MSIIVSMELDLLHGDVVGNLKEQVKEGCSFCGRKASAYWVGATTVRVCEQCALNVLPKLASDAVDLPRNPDKAREAARHMGADLKHRFVLAVDARLERMRESKRRISARQ